MIHAKHSSIFDKNALLQLSEFCFPSYMEWKTSSSQSLDRRNLGIVSIIGAVFLLSFSDALVKNAGDHLGLGQIVFLRSAFAALVIAGSALAFSGLGRLHSIPPFWVWARSLCLTVMWLCYYAALPSMSFALVAACYYTSPMWMALLSRLLLGEPVGGLRWLAIFLALTGVVLAVNPGIGTISPVIALPLASAFLYALAAVITWSRCQDEAPLTMALNLNVTLAVTGAVSIAALAAFGPGDDKSFVLSVWPTLMLEDWLLVGILGVLLAIIATAVAQAYRLAPSPIVGVFDNAYLLFAAMWGVLFFDEVPAMREAAGMALIASGAIMMTSRDHSTSDDRRSGFISSGR
ncbi:DMT family transporter [Nitratireductor sp. GCM10026969]|uniref:DMT family transporter n=1 Tax=Nitratireductor sp. GCM10026969 TaxID=3252645 RepID=UPI00361625CC